MLSFYPMIYCTSFFHYFYLGTLYAWHRPTPFSYSINLPVTRLVKSRERMKALNKYRSSHDDDER